MATHDQVWEAVNRGVVRAFAIIADLQMKTWAQYPSPRDPIEIVRTSIVEEIDELLGTKEG